jgi:hypothetical protein
MCRNIYYRRKGNSSHRFINSSKTFLFPHNAGELHVISFIREKCTKERLKKLLLNTTHTANWHVCF